MASSGAVRAGRAFVELFADNSKLEQGLRNAENQVKEFAKRTSEIGKQIASVGAVAAIPLAISTAIFANFDDQMRAVQAVTGSTGQQFDMLTEKAKELGRTTSFTAAQVASGMLELGRAGFKSDEIDASIKSVMDLARATQTEIPVATEIAGNALRSFNLDASEMARVSDVMTATANNSSQTLTDLGESLKYVAPVAYEAGMSLEDTAKSIGTLANFGIKGSMAGTALKNILSRMSMPEVRAEYDALGVAVADSSGNMRNLADIMKDLGKATASMPNIQKLGLFQKIFDMRAMAGGAKMTVAQFDQMYAAIDNAAGESGRVAATMDEGIGGAFRMFTSAAEGMAIAVGDSLAPEIKRVSEYLTEQQTEITNWIKENKETIVTVAEVAAKAILFGGSLYLVGKAASAASATIGILRTSAFALGKILPLLTTNVSDLGGVFSGAPKAANTAASATNTTAKTSEASTVAQSTVSYTANTNAITANTTALTANTAVITQGDAATKLYSVSLGQLSAATEAVNTASTMLNQSILANNTNITAINRNVAAANVSMSAFNKSVAANSAAWNALATGASRSNVSLTNNTTVFQSQAEAIVLNSNALTSNTRFVVSNRTAKTAQSKVNQTNTASFIENTAAIQANTAAQTNEVMANESSTSSVVTDTAAKTENATATATQTAAKTENAIVTETDTAATAENVLATQTETVATNADAAAQAENIAATESSIVASEASVAAKTENATATQTATVSETENAVAVSGSASAYAINDGALETNNALRISSAAANETATAAVVMNDAAIAGDTTATIGNTVATATNDAVTVSGAAAHSANAAAVLSDTAAIGANTTITATNTGSETKNTISTSANTAAIIANTTAKIQNTGATISVTSANTAATAAQSGYTVATNAATTASSRFAASVGGLVKMLPMLGGVAVLAGLIMIPNMMKEAAIYTAQLKNEMEDLQQAGIKGRLVDDENIQILQELSEKTALTSEEMQLAEGIISGLNAKYESFGATLDKTTGKILLTKESLEALSEEQRNQAIGEVNNRIAELQDNNRELEEESESYNKTMTNFHWFWWNNEKHMKDAQKKISNNTKKQQENRAKIKEQEELKKRILGGDDDAARGKTEKDKYNDKKIMSKIQKDIDDFDNKQRRDNQTALKNDEEDINNAYDKQRANIEKLIANENKALIPDQNKITEWRSKIAKSYVDQDAALSNVREKHRDKNKDKDKTVDNVDIDVTTAQNELNQKSLILSEAKRKGDKNKIALAQADYDRANVNLKEKESAKAISDIKKSGDEFNAAATEYKKAVESGDQAAIDKAAERLDKARSGVDSAQSYYSQVSGGASAAKQKDVDYSISSKGTFSAFEALGGQADNWQKRVLEDSLKIQKEIRDNTKKDDDGGMI